MHCFLFSPLGFIVEIRLDEIRGGKKGGDAGRLFLTGELLALQQLWKVIEILSS